MRPCTVGAAQEVGRSGPTFVPPADRLDCSSHRTRAWVVRVQRRKEDCLLASVVELVVYAALWEDRALVLAESAGDLLILARRHEPILQYTAKPEVGTLDQNQEFIGAWMYVWGIDPTRLEEAGGHADAQTR